MWELQFIARDEEIDELLQLLPFYNRQWVGGGQVIDQPVEPEADWFYKVWYHATKARARRDVTIISKLLNRPVAIVPSEY